MTTNLKKKGKAAILGAGGHAISVLGLLKAKNVSILGCIAPIPPGDGWPESCPWLGDDSELDKLDSTIVELFNGVGSIGSTKLRRKVFNAALKRGFRLPILVHPSAVIANSVLLDRGSQIHAGAILQPGVIAGENTLVNTGCVVDHNCLIGDHAHLAPGVTLSGNVRIGSGAHIGTAAVVIQGVCIGDYAVIGAGAVVTRDVAPGTTVVGNPARQLNHDI